MYIQRETYEGGIGTHDANRNHTTVAGCLGPVSRKWRDDYLLTSQIRAFPGGVEFTTPAITTAAYIRPPRRGVIPATFPINS